MLQNKKKGTNKQTDERISDIVTSWAAKFFDKWVLMLQNKKKGTNKQTEERISDIITSWAAQPPNEWVLMLQNKKKKGTDERMSDIVSSECVSKKFSDQKDFQVKKFFRDGWVTSSLWQDERISDIVTSECSCTVASKNRKKENTNRLVTSSLLELLIAAKNFKIKTMFDLKKSFVPKNLVDP